MFISDANFGSSWRDAPDSDQPFLSRFGLSVQQDNGKYALTRAAGDFATANHPVLFGVSAFDGEGVSPIVVPAIPPAGVTITRVVGARDKTRNNDGASAANKFAGSLRAVTSRDASLVLANAGRGRVVGYFDRNTFFNAHGAGTDITRLNNKQLALNLFGWVADQKPPALIASSFKQGAPSDLTLTFDDNLYGSLTRGDITLRNTATGATIASDRWSMSITESTGKSIAVIHIKAAQAAGAYQLQISVGKISDDSANATTSAIRVNFTIKPPAAPAVSLPRMAVHFAVRAPVAQELFAAAPIL
jgi:hypothetical protein